MNLLEAFEAGQLEIATGVTAAAEAVRADEPMSLSTFVKVRPNGSVSLYQPGETVTLTASQVSYLMERIGAGVRHHVEARL